MRPHAKFRMESRHCVWISGSFGLGDELARLDRAGRRPVWSSRQRAFCVSEGTARRALASLEHAGWDLLLEGPGASAHTASPESQVASTPGPSDLGAGLW